MFTKAFTPFTLSMAVAVVAGIELRSPDDDSAYIMAPAELKALVVDGMTIELLETIVTQTDVHIKMTNSSDIDELIDAVSALNST